jgi:hypothetical protein
VRSARRIAPVNPSSCRPAISATSSPATRQAHGPADRRLVIATNANDILARTLATGATRCAAWCRRHRPSMDIQVSSNFERLLFEALGRDAGALRG